MYIINQDRDMSIVYTKDSKLTYNINYINGVYFGINLLLDNIEIGTFDSLEEILMEIWCIKHCKYKYYIVNGFNDYKSCFCRGGYND